ALLQPYLWHVDPPRSRSGLRGQRRGARGRGVSATAAAVLAPLAAVRPRRGQGGVRAVRPWPAGGLVRAPTAARRAALWVREQPAPLRPAGSDAQGRVREAARRHGVARPRDGRVPG